MTNTTKPQPGDRVRLSNAALRAIGGIGIDLFGNPHPWSVCEGILLDGEGEHANVAWEGTGYLPKGPTQRWMLERVS